MSFPNTFIQNFPDKCLPISLMCNRRLSKEIRLLIFQFCRRGATKVNKAHLLGLNHVFFFYFFLYRKYVKNLRMLFCQLNITASPSKTISWITVWFSRYFFPPQKHPFQYGQGRQNTKENKANCMWISNSSVCQWQMSMDICLIIIIWSLQQRFTDPVSSII